MCSVQMGECASVQMGGYWDRDTGSFFVFVSAHLLINVAVCL